MYFIDERIRKILNELKGYVYKDSTKVGNFLCKDGNYSSIEAVEGSSEPWKDFGSDDVWGGLDVHCWFRTKLAVPEKYQGRTIALNISTGIDGWDATNPQFILYLDGEVVQGLDVNHREVIISNSAEPGRIYNIDLHAYGGRINNKSLLQVFLVDVDPMIRDIYYNIQVPLWVVEKLEKSSKTRMDIVTVLNETINLLDLRKPFSEMFYASLEKANEYIKKEFYEKMCGNTEAVATCVGHTHIDVAWHWTVAQTREKVARSFSTALRLMEEYPEFVFMSSQPQLYKFLKEDYPQIYEKIKQKVSEGVWEPEGAMWLEADCNVTSGESLVRQIMFGTRFFKKEFGVKNEVLWLPDVFGYSAALPQILQKSGIKYFMTTKISWNQFNMFPYDTFMWRGIDGTEILTYFITTKDPYYNPNSFFTTYNGQIHPGSIMGGWERYQQKNINNDILISYGFGDGGGGPTMEMLETARRMSKGIPGCPKVQMGTSADFFHRLEDAVKGDKRLPKWVGELYFEYHRGTYTSMARNKRDNRKSEFTYQNAEFLSAVAMGMGLSYPQDSINRAWENILLNQFHDILPGTSIKEVYDVTKKEYEQILESGKGIINNALGVIAPNIRLNNASVLVFNTSSFKRSDVAVVDMPQSSDGLSVRDENGNILPGQVIDDNGTKKYMFFATNVPPRGYKAFTMLDGNATADSGIQCEEDRLENRFFRINLDKNGRISSLYDKVNRRQILKEGEKGNVLQAFEDKPMNYDCWDIDIYYQEKMWEIDNVESMRVIENGPVRAGIEIRRHFLDSIIVQKVFIYSDIPRVDFDTYIDWKESQILLKAAFPVDVHADKATYDIQFGNLERSTHWNTSWDIARFEVCGHKWADLSEEGYGVSLLNDSKYGYDIKDGVMRLTLLKSGIELNTDADKEEHHFVYSLYPHAGGWKEGKTVEMAYGLNLGVYSFIEEAHDGSLPETLSFISSDCGNVVIDTVKKAEDSDDIIVRIFECHNKRSEVTVTYYKEIEDVTECTLMEDEISNVAAESNQFTFTIKPYEIKTFKIKSK